MRTVESSTGTKDLPCSDAKFCAEEDTSTTAFPEPGTPVVRQPAEKQAEISSEILRHGGRRENAGGPRSNSGGRRLGAGRKSRAAGDAGLSAGPRWHVVEIIAGAEEQVIEDLTAGECRPGFVPREAFETFLPVTAKIGLHRGRRTVAMRPMLTGYGFVRFDARVANWTPILRCDGVRGVLRSRAGRPVPVPEGDIAYLMKASRTHPDNTVVAMPCREPGQNLVVAEGPFTSFAAVVIACDGVTTQASVSIFGRSTPVLLPYTAFDDA